MDEYEYTPYFDSMRRSSLTDEYEYTPYFNSVIHSMDDDVDIDAPLSADYCPDDMDDCVVIHRTQEEEEELRRELDRELDEMHRERSLFTTFLEYTYYTPITRSQQHIIGRVLVKISDYGFVRGEMKIPPGFLESDDDDVPKAFFYLAPFLLHQKEEYCDRFIGDGFTK